jgi:hypothetical protein
MSFSLSLDPLREQSTKLTTPRPLTHTVASRSLENGVNMDNGVEINMQKRHRFSLPTVLAIFLVMLAGAALGLTRHGLGPFGPSVFFRASVFFGAFGPLGSWGAFGPFQGFGSWDPLDPLGALGPLGTLFIQKYSIQTRCILSVFIVMVPVGAVVGIYPLLSSKTDNADDEDYAENKEDTDAQG